MTIFSFYQYWLLMVKKVSYAFFESFSLRWFSFVCSRESDVVFASFSNVASNGLFLCIVASPGQRIVAIRSVEMFWIDLTKAIHFYSPRTLIILY